MRTKFFQKSALAVMALALLAVGCGRNNRVNNNGLGAIGAPIGVNPIGVNPIGVNPGAVFNINQIVASIPCQTGFPQRLTSQTIINQPNAAGSILEAVGQTSFGDIIHVQRQVNTTQFVVTTFICMGNMIQHQAQVAQSIVQNLVIQPSPTLPVHQVSSALVIYPQAGLQLQFRPIQ